MEHAILQDIRRDEEIVELRSEVTRLRGLLFGGDAALEARLRLALNLTPGEAWILATLFKAGGRVVSMEQLAEGLPGHGEAERRGNGVHVRICRIRKKLPSTETIQTLRGLGFSITSEAIEFINHIC
ncbi:helix-turn-helix domain-containing protein [Novosphingobium resinovorum]|uniref:helix-turn-helix domain-containing protein n=1 Tax=Novosphingobium resinovorum TaxID=158500 RepID=UPI0009F6B211|nr:helix-turn-helix domain-containing protein [Novosphingobium resinovorum]